MKVFSLFTSLLLFLLPVIPVEASVITFAYQNGVNYVTAMVAERKGFFADYDLKVEGRLLTSGPLVSESIVSGVAGVGMMGDTPAIIAVTKNLPVTILASVAGGPGRNRLMVNSKKEIEKIHDLEGKRIGITFGTSSHGALYSLAEQNSIALDTIQLINIRPMDMIEALATDQVDAVLVWEPTPTMIEKTGVGIELITLECIGNEFPTFLMINNRLLERNPEIGYRFLLALNKANQFINENWEEAITIAAEFTGIDEEILSLAMEYIYYDINLSQETINSFMQTALFLKEYESISSLPILENSFDKSYLKKLQEKK